MIYGRFGGSSDQPYVSSVIVLPNLGSKGLTSLVFDTGADRTVLMPADGLRLGVDYTKLGPASPLDGIGGSVSASFEDAWLMFHDTDQSCFYGYHVPAAIVHPPSTAVPQSNLLALPSLLGRDIINRWRFAWDRSSQPGLEATPLSHDLRL